MSERQEQIASLKSEIEALETRYKYWMNEATKPRFSRRWGSLDRQNARHKAARIGDRLIELKEKLADLVGGQSEAA